MEGRRAGLLPGQQPVDGPMGHSSSSCRAVWKGVVCGWCSLVRGVGVGVPGRFGDQGDDVGE